MKTTNALFRARVDAKRLERARKVLDRIGLNPGEAVNLFFAQVALRGDLPFTVTAHPERLQSDKNQADAWNDALGEY